MRQEQPGKAQPKGASLVETARLLGGVSTKTVSRMIREGRLRAVRVHKRVIVPLSEIERLMEGQ
jgi:excisionase family DNA binding protein